jgi:hypothetical protein
VVGVFEHWETAGAEEWKRQAGDSQQTNSFVERARNLEFYSTCEVLMMK